MARGRSQAVQKAREIGPYSRPITLAKLDGRKREALLMRGVREKLLAHLGRPPTFPERLLIERAAVLTLRLAQIEVKIIAGGDALTLHDNNHAIAWHNALRRTLAAIGLQPAAAAPPTIDDLRASVVRERDERRRQEAAA
jgi:hypothetical protein